MRLAPRRAGSLIFCSCVRGLSKARLTRVSSRPAWSTVACGLWSRAKSARLGFEPCVAYPARNIADETESTLPSASLMANWVGYPRSSSVKENMDEIDSAQPMTKQPTKPISRSSQLRSGQHRQQPSSFGF
eukprot:scaffold10820_cov54-Phaeocystis_antarctica.AAC.1